MCDVRRLHRIPALVLLLAAAPAVGSIGSASLLERADVPHAAFPEGAIKLRVVVHDRDKPPAESRIDLYVKGKDDSLCVFTEGKQEGRRVLSVGDKVWLLVPGSARAVPVTKSQRLMGAASFGDIARMRFADEFDAVPRSGEESVTTPKGEVACQVLDLSAKRKAAPYPKAVLWVGRVDGLPRRLRLSLASGKEAKEIRYLSYDADHRLQSMEIRDLMNPGDNTTELTFESYEPRKLDAAMFDPEGAKTLP